ncbi:MAG: alpha/beta hydrolase [Caenibius sp.]
MAHTHFKNVGKLRVAYEAAGEGDPLILLHGGEGDSGMFTEIIPYLAQSFLTIAYDQRGCGGTTCDDKSDYSLEDLADDAAGFIEALGYEKAHVLGHSAGGLVAQMLAVRSPHRIDKLILESTSPITTFKKTMSDGAIQEHGRRISQGGLASVAEYFTTPEYMAEHPEFVDRLKEIKATTSPEAMVQRLKALQTFEDIDLSQIQNETLAIYAERDQLVARDSFEHMANDVLPNARLEIYPDAGHASVVMFPEGYAKLITAFLKG